MLDGDRLVDQQHSLGGDNQVALAPALVTVRRIETGFSTPVMTLSIALSTTVREQSTGRRPEAWTLGPDVAAATRPPPSCEAGSRTSSHSFSRKVTVQSNLGQF